MSNKINNKISKNLQAGINYLEAKRAEGGYRYYDDAMSQFYVSSESDVRLLGRRLNKSFSDSGSANGEIYSFWCAETSAKISKAQ